MVVTTTVKQLELSEALERVEAGAAFVDMRPVRDYLDAHIPGSLELLFERGPGFATRARDCLPLTLELVILDLGWGDPVHATAALRGKGFSVVGTVNDGINHWSGAKGRAPASTEQLRGNEASGDVLLSVGDPGAPEMEVARHIPIEQLWRRVGELQGARRVVILAGHGVRAALAVGILERTGISDVGFWWP